MIGKFLLDTNVVIALLSGDANVRASLNSAAEIFLSSIVRGELYYGAANSSRPETNTRTIEEFSASCTEIPVDGATAAEYGAIKFRLKTVGRPIPENDLWLAASALQHNLTLVTRDHHFHAVDGIEVVAW